MYAVCPFGEKRSDLRSAYHVTSLMASQSTDEINDEDFRETVRALCDYLKCDQDQTDAVDHEALRRLKNRKD